MIKLSGLTVLALFVATAGWGQTSTPSQQPSQGGSSGQGAPPSQTPPSGQLPSAQPVGPSGQLPGAGQPVVAPQVNAQEETDYKAFYDSRGGGDVQKEIQLGEDFVKNYPTSRYVSVVYAVLAGVYMNQGEEDKMFSCAQKSIDARPDNVDALSLMVWAGARRINPQAPDAAEKFAKYENYAHQAIALIAAMAKPANVDDAAFNAARNDKLSMCHSGLGLMDFMRQRYADAITEMTQAVQLADHPDQVDFFILGRADEYTNHFDDALAAFGKCTAIAGGIQDRCTSAIDDTKKRALEQPAPSH
jgi:tetratricopeptide (TPR) repeat protein